MRAGQSQTGQLFICELINSVLASQVCVTLSDKLQNVKIISTMSDISEASTSMDVAPTPALAGDSGTDYAGGFYHPKISPNP